MLVISKTLQTESDFWQIFNGNFNRSTPEQVPQMKNLRREFLFTRLAKNFSRKNFNRV